jgi:hypothetical protein
LKWLEEMVDSSTIRIGEKQRTNPILSKEINHENSANQPLYAVGMFLSLAFSNQNLERTVPCCNVQGAGFAGSVGLSLGC